MAEQRESRAKVWVEYTGYVVNETQKAVAIAGSATPRKPEFWIPKSLLGQFSYTQARDEGTVRVGERIEGFQVELWWARKYGLVKD